MTRLIFERHEKRMGRLQAFCVMGRHVHLLTSLPPEMVVSEFVKELKSTSGKAIKSRLTSWSRRNSISSED